MPRLTNSAERVRQLKQYTPNNSWAEHRALAGQNDYIDLLGNDDIHPKQIMYHVPKYLRGVNRQVLDCKIFFTFLCIEMCTVPTVTQVQSQLFRFKSYCYNQKARIVFIIKKRQTKITPKFFSLNWTIFV